MPRLRSSARSVSRPSRAGRSRAGLLLAAQIGLTLPFGLAAMPALAQSPAPVTTPAQSPPVQSAPALEPAAQTSAPEQPTPDQTATNLPASDAAAAPSAGDAPVAALLPHDLSPWGMFLAADWVVQAVMIGLVLASVLTWTIWLAKSLEIGVAQRRLKRVLAGLLASAGMEEARRVALSGPSAAMMNAAQLELRRSADLPAEGIKERIALSLGRIEIAAGRAINRGTGVLATIGAISPFVGLFGTVWGIMNAFIGISKTQTTNLAVVAPGIAEALLATAIGLVAAIPAVVIYNYFARRVAGYRVLAGDAAAEVLRLVSRDLDRRDARYSSGGSAGGRLRAAAE